MIKFIARRFSLMVVTLLMVSIISFIIIQLPPGDFLTSYIGNLMLSGDIVDNDEIEALKVRYGLGEPIYVQYFKWMNGILHGDLGRSMHWGRPVSVLIKDRLPWSFTISMVSFLFVWAIALPIGIYSATHQYSIPDYIATLLGFIGLAVPNFLIALLVLWWVFRSSGQVIVGLFSPDFVQAPWSVAKVVDLLKHLWLPALIVGTSGTAGTIRTIRANMLDELSKPYVMMARAKGVAERKLLIKYPLRVALIPAASTIGWILPGLFAGELIVSSVLGIPTLSPIFFQALRSQDMFLAGSIVLILSALTVVGSLISDIILALVDPRIRGSV